MAAAKMESILTVERLAGVLSITEPAARGLMESTGFPSTRIADGAYVVERALLEQWVRLKAQRVKGINDGDLSEFFGAL